MHLRVLVVRVRGDRQLRRERAERGVDLDVVLLRLPAAVLPLHLHGVLL
jgi:hypothetical protein